MALITGLTAQPGRKGCAPVSMYNAAVLKGETSSLAAFQETTECGASNFGLAASDVEPALRRAFPNAKSITASVPIGARGVRDQISNDLKGLAFASHGPVEMYLMNVEGTGSGGAGEGGHWVLVVEGKFVDQQFEWAIVDPWVNGYSGPESMGAPQQQPRFLDASTDARRVHAEGNNVIKVLF